DLVDEKDLGLQMRGDGEGESDVHPTGVELHRRVQEALDLGEGHDLVEVPLDLDSLHPQDRAVQVDVLPPRQLRVEARADLEERADSAVNLRGAGRRIGDAGQDLEQGAVPGAVSADHADDLTPSDLEGDVLEGPERAPRLATGRAGDIGPVACRSQGADRRV